MTATIIDFKTRKTLSKVEPVEQQQATFSRETMMVTLQEVVEMMETQGYKFEGSILIMESRHKGTAPVCIGMNIEGSAQSMIDLIKPAYVNLVKTAKMEEMPDVPA